MVQGAVGNGNAILCVVLIIENILGNKYCEKNKMVSSWSLGFYQNNAHEHMVI